MTISTGDPLAPTGLVASLFNLFRASMGDVAAAIDKYDIALVFGVQDISQRHRRSRIGVFWLTINMGVMILALGMIFGTILRSNMHAFLPFMRANCAIAFYQWFPKRS